MVFLILAVYLIGNIRPSLTKELVLQSVEIYKKFLFLFLGGGKTFNIIIFSSPITALAHSSIFGDFHSVA